MSATIDKSLGVPIARVAHFQYGLDERSEPADFRSLPVGVERHLRLHLRALLNQSDGTWDVTNAIADDLALILMRDFDVREKS